MRANERDRRDEGLMRKMRELEMMKKKKRGFRGFERAWQV